MNDLSGVRIGRYEVIRMIGSGGMACVYLAYDTVLKRETAIKLVKKDAFSESEFDIMRQRFLNEAQNMAQLNHPNIVKIYDIGEYDSSPYFVMELLNGSTLRNMTGSPIPAHRAASLLVPIADALAYIHSKGYLHRDVKPSNIIINSEGSPILTDFGISRTITETPDTPVLTQAGKAIGTPDYMAPEQALGKTIDGRADEYALGAIFYELLTGTKLYQGDSQISVIMQHVNSPIPSAKKINPNITAYEEAVLEKALAKDPNDRYPSMKAFEAALRSIADGTENGNIASDVSETVTTLEPIPSVSSGVSESKPISPKNQQGDIKEPAAEKTRKPGAWLIPALVVLAAISVLGIRMLTGNNQTRLLPVETAESQITFVISTATEFALPIENSSVSEKKPELTDKSTPTAHPAAYTAQVQEQNLYEVLADNNEETPEEKYGLWFTTYEVKNVTDANGIIIRKTADTNGEIIGGKYSLVRNGDILEATGKTLSDNSGKEWIGVRTIDGYEGFLPADILERKTKGISISVADFEYEIKGNDVTINKYKGVDSRIIIPSMFEGKQLTKIGGRTFHNNADIRAVVIPEGVVSIGKNAFDMCVSLEYVSLPESLEIIDDFGFYHTNLSSITFPKNIQKIGQDAFCFNENLTSVIIPEQITEINNYVFYSCESLSYVEFPENLISIGSNAFSNTALTEISLPAKMKKIGYRAFMDCKLTNVVFPEDLSYIDKEAFLNNRLSTVTLSKYTEYEQNSFDENVQIVKIN